MREAIEVKAKPVESGGLMPALSINQLVARYGALVEATKRVLREGVDYGAIPGAGSKPVLLKPGAEKLAALFGLRPRFEIIEKIEDWNRGLFYYLYRCRLYHGDEVVAEADGSANSREKKYRWRLVPEWEYDPGMGEPVRWETRRGRRGTYRVAVFENREPYDLVNTLQKMAQKRALVAAVLIATGASEFFTQDLEDLNGEGIEEAPAEKRAAKGEQAKKRPRAQVNGEDLGQRVTAQLSALGLGGDEVAVAFLAAMVVGRDEPTLPKALSEDELARFSTYLTDLIQAANQVGIRRAREYLPKLIHAGVLPPPDPEGLKQHVEEAATTEGEGGDTG